MNKASEQELEILEDKLAKAKEWRMECTKRVALYQPDPDNYEEEFCDYINNEYESQHGQLRIRGIAITPSTALRLCDPTAYYEKLNNYTEVAYTSNRRSDKYYMTLMEDLELALADYLKAVEDLTRAKA